MADILLNKVINEEININIFISWLSKATFENETDLKQILNCNTGQIDFITYFLNFIHEEVPCNNKFGETPQKLNTPKRIDKVQETGARDHCHNLKHNLFSQTPQNQNTSFNLSLEVSTNKNSTPKYYKTPNKSFNKNDSYYSPISPLYQNRKIINHRENKTASSSKSFGEKHSVCLGDFMINSSKSSSKKKKLPAEPLGDRKEASRRIKPTSICSKQLDSGFKKTDNSFNFEENQDEVKVASIIEQRNLLVEEKLKILSKQGSFEKTSSPMLLKRHNSIKQAEIKPCLHEVTYMKHLNMVVSIYTTLLNHGMVLNITSEIYFLLSLLLSKPVDFSHSRSKVSINDNSNEETNLGVKCLDSSLSQSVIPNKEECTKISLYNSEIFESIHNIVYFAVKCLTTQIDIIKLYDKSTIRLLAENERIQEFSQEFSKNLLNISENKNEKISLDTISPDSQGNVCFNVDTDNKENFPDQLCFHAFRKQRDLFYEILRVWENHHLSTDWSFSTGLGGKIRTLFSLSGEPTNYLHLARLFKNQLLSSCVKSSQEKGLSEKSVKFLPSLAIDADKLNRLTSRLVTKQSSNGINSLPVFTGYQEFYKNFIVEASNHFFNKHLSDSLASEIIELNETQFSTTDLEDGSNPDLSTRKLYINCIKNLRILAKFLGFLESLPYKSDFAIPKDILDTQISIRKMSYPPIDLKNLLVTATKKKKLILVIPWLTNYLAMLDYATLRLPFYMSMYVMLFDLYYTFENSKKLNYNTALVKFCLGWLFELPHFPDSEYYNFCSKNYKVQNGLQSESPSKKLKNSVIQSGTKNSPKKLEQELDNIGIVNESILYFCCPYIEEIKKLLTSASSNRVAVKYITPVTAVESNSEMSRKKLEQQLEEFFFNGQPASLRKTVEFVSERVASTAVKCICHDLVPKAKQVAVKDLRENLFKNDVSEQYIDLYQRKDVLKQQSSAIAQNHLTKFLKVCDKEILNISSQKISTAIDSLLPIDTLDKTKLVCVEIATKIYLERVTQWMNSHVTLSVFTKDFDSEIQKFVYGKRLEKEKAAFLLPSGGRDSFHNEDSISPFHILDRIRDSCCDVTEDVELSDKCLIEMLDETFTCISERNDVSDMIVVNICQTLFDLLLLLVTNRSNFLLESNNLLSKFSRVWTLNYKPNNLFKSLFCLRNLKMLDNSSDKIKAWDTYAKVIAYLVERKLISQEDLESQCTGFYNRDWDEDTLSNFSEFLKKFLGYSNCDGADSKFAMLLGFLSDFCSDL